MNGNYRTSFGGWGESIPPVVRWLLISNVLIFLATMLSPGASATYFGLVPRFVWSRLMIWQLLTYMFLHGGFFHILLNMFILWMFGSDLERTWGSKEFLKYYLICGIGAGLFNVLLQPNSMVPIIGASGAIYGVLVAFAVLFPNRLVYIYFLFPVKVKHLVIVLAGLQFIMSVSGSRGNIAYLAHLGGMVVGYIYLRGPWQIRSFKFKLGSYIHRSKRERITRQREKEEHLMEEVDQILDKINRVGYDNLSRRERKILEEASDKLSKK